MIETIVGAIGAFIILYLFNSKKNKDKQIEELEQKKQAVQAQVNQLKTDADGLKSKIEDEQANVTEEQKDEFWKNYTKPDTDK